MISRSITLLLEKHLKKNKIIHIPGPRQVGKTTLLMDFSRQYKGSLLWWNGDESDIRAELENPTSTKIKKLIGSAEMVIIDEAQRITDIGLILKLIYDNLKQIKVIVTGSSTLDLSNKINETLTGRKTELFLFPLSFAEMIAHTNLREEKRLLEHRLIYGYYPEVVTAEGEEKDALKRLSDAYLYKDLFAFEYIKKPALLEKLLQALALQLGNEVSYNELSGMVGADKETVENYIRYLEQAYVVFTLNSLSRNQRNEIKKGKKVYFYDNGVRNALIRNFSPLSLRNDTGALWENFLISERMKYMSYKEQWMNRYFWRTHAQQEVDYIEEHDGRFYAYEFKWNPAKKAKLPETFRKAYPDNDFLLVNRENYPDFISS
jgi:uncharacterized protein